MPPNQDEVIAARVRATYDKDFMPSDGPPDARQAKALEYIAGQMGEMRKDINVIRAAVEALTKKP